MQWSVSGLQRGARLYRQAMTERLASPAKNSSADLPPSCVCVCVCIGGCVHACSGNSGVALVECSGTAVFTRQKQWNLVKTNKGPFCAAASLSLTFLVEFGLRILIYLLILTFLLNCCYWYQWYCLLLLLLLISRILFVIVI